MKRNEKIWKIAELVLGVVGAAMLMLLLVLKFVGKDVTVLAYPIVGIVILFLICDEIARSIRRRREKEEAAAEDPEQAEQPEREPTMPTEAFDFEEETETKQP